MAKVIIDRNAIVRELQHKVLDLKLTNLKQQENKNITAQIKIIENVIPSIQKFIPNQPKNSVQKTLQSGIIGNVQSWLQNDKKQPGAQEKEKFTQFQKEQQDLMTNINYQNNFLKLLQTNYSRGSIEEKYQADLKDSLDAYISAGDILNDKEKKKLQNQFDDLAAKISPAAISKRDVEASRAGFDSRINALNREEAKIELDDLKNSDPAKFNERKEAVKNTYQKLFNEIKSKEQNFARYNTPNNRSNLNQARENLKKFEQQGDAAYFIALSNQQTQKTVQQAAPLKLTGISSNAAKNDQITKNSLKEGTLSKQVAKSLTLEQKKFNECKDKLYKALQIKNQRPKEAAQIMATLNKDRYYIQNKNQLKTTIIAEIKEKNANKNELNSHNTSNQSQDKTSNNLAKSKHINLGEIKNKELDNYKYAQSQDQNHLSKPKEDKKDFTKEQDGPKDNKSINYNKL